MHCRTLAQPALLRHWLKFLPQLSLAHCNGETVLPQSFGQVLAFSGATHLPSPQTGTTMQSAGQVSWLSPASHLPSPQIGPVVGGVRHWFLPPHCSSPLSALLLAAPSG